MSCYSKAAERITGFPSVIKNIESSCLPMALTGLSNIHKAHFIHSICEITGRRAIVLTPDESGAVRLASDIAEMASESAPPVLTYVAKDFTFRDIDGISREYEHERLGVLSKLAREEYSVAVCSAEAATQFTMPPEELIGRSVVLRSGEDVSIDDTVSSLVAAGYTRCEQVEGKGQFARRGGILDFFPPDSDMPVRVEFWGDTIDLMAYFDPEDQRRTDSIGEAAIIPALEVVFDGGADLADKIEKFLSTVKGCSSKAKRLLSGDADRARGGLIPSSTDRYLPLAYDRSATIFDYAEDAILFVCESASVESNVRSARENDAEEIKLCFEQGLLCPGLDTFSLDLDALLARFGDQGAVYLDNFTRGGYSTPIRFTQSVQAGQLSSWSGGLSSLTEDLDLAYGSDSITVIMAGTPKAAVSLHSDLLNEGYRAILHKKQPDEFSEGAVNVVYGSLSAGMTYRDARFQLISYGGRHTAVQTRGSRRKRKPAEIFNSLEELRRGDYVVHASHGIGIFQGINKLEVEGLVKDYITIKYAGEDVLYVPVTQLDLVSKYIGGGGDEDGKRVRLHRLGGQQWQRTRSRVRSAVRDMAKELTALYRERLNTPGHAFMADTDMQNDFERRFEYEETDDQLRCIREIKRDMESTAPMDRLLCGDVGFGKTEVALRASFKCIAEGKQCAILVPTTILAYQHYQTLVKRMDGFPVEIDMLSRFRTAKEQRAIFDKARRGALDIVVGTHRLFSKDLQFRDLGLLIVDEEQRFGVGQKEKLKALFPAVDVLTLSATPIPRTLNMAMSGIRDMSIIEEAPQDRHPVQTYVVEYDFGIVTDAIGRELRRGGQVYYLRNRIDGIERTALKLAQEFPNATVEVAHGAMSEEQLSGIWRRLMEGEVDILVCTTIIETGVDVPNVNTLIIENADRMGLSQLHQLRGRVGRSTRRAFAYLTFSRGKALSEAATNRLSAIREYTEFGAGMKIAMRDLEIRGAGNILGAQQHGHMEDVGYDLYLKLLNEAVREEKGEKSDEPEKECLIDLQVQAHIPEDYIPFLPQRLAIYRRIAEVRSEEDAEDVYDELIDRFGDVPPSVQGLVDVALMRNLASAADIYEITQLKDSLVMKLSRLNMERIAEMSAAVGRRLLVSPSETPTVTVRFADGQTPMDCLKEVLTKGKGSGNLI